MNIIFSHRLKGEKQKKIRRKILRDVEINQNCLEAVDSIQGEGEDFIVITINVTSIAHFTVVANFCASQDIFPEVVYTVAVRASSSLSTPPRAAAWPAK